MIIKSNINLTKELIDELEGTLQEYKKIKNRFMLSPTLFKSCEALFKRISNDYCFNLSNEERKVVDKYLSEKNLINIYFHKKQTRNSSK